MRERNSRDAAVFKVGMGSSGKWYVDKRQASNSESNRHVHGSEAKNGNENI